MRASLKGTPTASRATMSLSSKVTNIYENITLGPDKEIIVDSQLSLLIPEHVSFLLCNYSQLKQDTNDYLNSDLRWMLIELEDLITAIFPENSVYYDLIV